MPPRVTVYTKPDCRQCDMTKMVLNRLGVDYEVEDIREPSNLAMVQELGYLAAPVVIVSKGDLDDVHWSGFRDDLLKEHAAS